MDNTGTNDRFSVTTPARYHSSCSAIAVGTAAPKSQSGDRKHSCSKECDHQNPESTTILCTHPGSDATSQILTNKSVGYSSLIQKQTSSSLLPHTEHRIGEASDSREVLQKPMQFTEDVMEHNQLVDHTSQQNSICNLKDQLDPEMLEADKVHNSICLLSHIILDYVYRMS